MPLPRLCGEDPLVKELRTVFKANIVRVPEERVVPLSVLLRSNGRVRFMGHVDSFLEGKPLKSEGDILESQMPAMTNRRTSLLENSAGVEILSAFLGSMADGGAPQVSTHFKESKSFRFAFPSVRREYIELGRLGALLKKRAFDKGNAFFQALVDPKSAIFMVDSAITSSDIRIEAADDDSAGLKVDVTGLQAALAGAKIELTAQDAKHISFRSKRRLTFAFTCVAVTLSSNGAIRSVSPANDQLQSPEMAAVEERGDRGLAEHVLLTRKPEYVELAFE